MLNVRGRPIATRGAVPFAPSTWSILLLSASVEPFGKMGAHRRILRRTSAHRFLVYDGRDVAFSEPDRRRRREGVYSNEQAPFVPAFEVANPGLVLRSNGDTSSLKDS